MATPLETFREWERDAPSTVCHVMMIERGNGAAANRLTLTDKPYYDKGVAGTKYHQTYPAPLHCIVSEIVTDEEQGGSKFDDIVLANGDGLLDTILSGEVIATKSFVMMRGDTRWSLVSDAYPERFTEIFRGTIESVTFDRGGGKVRLAIGPVKYSLDNTLATPTQPVGIGSCYNVPAVLVDAANRKYRVNSIRLGSGSDFSLHDNGATLATPGDYSRILENDSLAEDAGGKFRGKVQLVSAPSGSVTAVLNYNTPLGRGLWLISRTVRDYLVDSYVPEPSQFGPSGFPNGKCMWITADGAKAYLTEGTSATSARKCYQFSLGTSGDITTATSDSKTLDFASQMGTLSSDPTPCTIQLSSDGFDFYTLASDGMIYQYVLGTTRQLDTGSYVDSFDLSTLGLDADYCRAMYMVDGGIYVVEKRDVYFIAMTGNDITTLSSPELILTLDVEFPSSTEFVTSIEFSADGMKFYYVCNDSLRLVRQINLLEAFDLTQHYYPGRSYFFDSIDITNTMSRLGISSFRMSADGDVFYIYYNYLDSTLKVLQFTSITDSDLPRDLVRSRPDEIDVGVFYSSETRIGQVLADLAVSVGREFYVARDGAIVLAKVQSASAAVTDGQPYIDISLGDMIGDQGSHIVHQSTLPPLAKVTARWKVNYSPIPQSQSAGTLTLQQKEDLATEFKTKATTNTLTNYDEAGEQLIDSYCQTTDAADYIADAIAEFRSVPRQFFEIKVALGAISMLSPFDVGAVMRVVGDVRHPALSDGDYIMLAGRRTNWTKNQHQLRVHK